MTNKECSKCIHKEVCKTAESCDGYVSGCKHFKEGWISVKDRLPEYEEPVMGWDAEMRDMGIVNFIYGKFFDILDMSETNVTHWMHLPQPPKGE